MKFQPSTQFAGGVTPAWAQNESANEPKNDTAAMRTPNPATPATKPAMKLVAVKASPPKKKSPMKVDVSKLVIEDTPYNPMLKRLGVKSMYDSHFTRLKDGQCIKCKPDECGAVSNGMRNWFGRRGFEVEVVAISKCDDGAGRVWLMARKPVKVAA